jgi:SAM-dependent methyltransferase
MSDSVSGFYDGLAEAYHFIFADWRRSVKRQGTALDRLIRTRKGTLRLGVLDCTCGIGTQAFGLAEQGYTVHGTDLSPVAIQRAREYAVEFDRAPTFAVADLLAPDLVDKTTYDVVIACDNAVAHFLTDDDLMQAIDTMVGKLRPGGLLLISLRDYDQIVLQRPRSTLPVVTDAADGRHITLQVWDWATDGRSYDLNHFVVHEEDGTWRTECHRTTLRVLQRRELEMVLQETGLTDIEWHLPPDSGYYQPIVTAVKEQAR